MESKRFVLLLLIGIIDGGRNNNGIYVFHPDSLLNDSRQYYVYNLDNGKIRSNEFVIFFVTAKVVCGLEPPVKAFLSASQDKLMISWNSGIMMRMTGW